MASVMSEIIEYLTGSLTAYATAFGEGVMACVKTIIFETSTSGEVTGLSAFGGIVFVLFGVTLAIGLTSFVTHFLTSMGK